MIIFTDIHGCYESFLALLKKIPQEEIDKGVAFCGDLIDRGKDSRKVIQWAIDNKVHCIRGNHEDMALGLHMGNPRHQYTIHNAIDHIAQTGNIPRGMGNWLPQGGFSTLCSYEEFLMDQLDDRGAPTKVFAIDVLEEHIKYLENLPYFLEFKDIKNDKGQHLLLTHASASNIWHWGDKKRKQQKMQFEENIVWNRNLNPKVIPDVYNIFGHTPREDKATVRDHYSCIDTGCVYSNLMGLGRLTALQFPEMITYVQEYVG